MLFKPPKFGGLFSFFLLTESELDYTLYHMSIHLLPDEVASQIAAGEVVERPASVVKELVENSLDAGANYIAIRIEGAGQKMIEVADNGEGIPGEELKLALSRHSTSKLDSVEDLSEIQTLGFRGEALASIASVSRFTITSCNSKAGKGGKLLVEGGEMGIVESVGAPVGTIVQVEDLFYNVPARAKFLKSEVTERRNIDAFCTRYALAYPSVRFELTQKGRTGLHTSGNGDRREVLASLYNPDIARKMLEVDTSYDNLRVNGFISPIGITRANRSAITFFVNGRWIQDVSLTTALVQAYHSMLMVGRYPMGILFLEMPPSHLDVNVHPAKAEVRFINKNEVFSGVQRAVRRALLAYSPVPSIPDQVRWVPSPTGDKLSGQEEGNSESELEKKTTKTEGVQTSLPSSGVPLLHLVGQVGSSYLVAEGPDGLYLVDQHAAHERILFERFMAQISSTIPSQVLLEPATITLSAEESQLLDEQIDLLKKLGFEVELFGPNSYRLRAMPAMLIGSNPEAALRVVIEDFEEDESPLQDEIEARIIARVCKRAAVKAGQALSEEEQRVLLRDLERCQAPRTCPHGRPTMIHLSIDLLERQFGRKGPR